MSEQQVEIIVDGKTVSSFDHNFYMQILPIYKLEGKNGKLIIDTSTGLIATLKEA